MSVDLPRPIVIYIDAENRGDTEAIAQCFAENAVVRDEGKAIEGLAAIKQWNAETKKKYNHMIEPLASAEQGSKIVFTNRPLGISPAVPSSLNSSSPSTAKRSYRWRSAHKQRSRIELQSESSSRLF